MEIKEEVDTSPAGWISPRDSIRASGTRSGASMLLLRHKSSKTSDLEDRRSIDTHSILEDPHKKSLGELKFLKIAKKLKIAKQRNACLQFAEVILFMVGFLFLMWIHEDIKQVFELEITMKIEMTKPFGEHSVSFNEINDVVGIWEWLEHGLLPVIVTHKDALGDLLPRDEWGFIAEYNRVIGGLRIYQERSKSEHCHYSELKDFYSHCQPFETVDKQSFGLPECSSFTEIDSNKSCYNGASYEGAVDFFHDEGFSFDHDTGYFEIWIDLLDDDEVINKRLKYLEDRHWLDKQTKEVTFELLVLNGQHDPLICEIKLSCLFTRVGRVEPAMSIETVPLSPYHSRRVLKWVLEFIFVVYLCRTTFSIFKRIRAHKTERQTSSESQFEKTSMSLKTSVYGLFASSDEPVSNVVDLVTVSIGVTICIVWANLVFAMNAAETALKTLHRPEGEVAYDDNDADVWSVYHHDIAHIEHLVEEIIHNMVLTRTFSFFMVDIFLKRCMLALFGSFKIICIRVLSKVIVIIFMMLKTWENIPSLRGISATLYFASSRLVPLGVIVSCFVCVFAGAGMLAFGQQLEEFHDFTTAVVTTLVAFTTESEVYGKQFAINPLTASVWHWLLVCIMSVICLHLVLCILVESYGEAAQYADDDKSNLSLFEQGVDTAKYLVERYRQTYQMVEKVFFHPPNIHTASVVAPEQHDGEANKPSSNLPSPSSPESILVQEWPSDAAL
mmetsp:Transcript_56874/g.106822  ORF Transcript_56874/g.106822 Transcript_56874/m.106822 type:complete len:727 (-) Transcript_56874:173-2353(-)